jgi:DNA-binding NtrC family response regulator
MKVPTALPHGCEILVVEDDSKLRRRLAAHLRALGAHPVEASTLAEARRFAADRCFDFALTDLHLPDGDALELLRERVFSENTCVVVMTAFGGIAKAVEAMRLGADDYLTKPFEPEQVAVAFMRWRAQQAAERRESHRSDQPAAPEFFFGESLAPLRANLERIRAPSCAQPAAGSHRGRDRHWQEPAGALASPRWSPGGPSFHRDQLRRPPGESRRVRFVRT